jgi:hypothetical protein
MMNLSSAPWNLSEGQNSCNSCLKRTSSNPTLFEDFKVKKNDQCLDGNCWKSKMNVHIKSLTESENKPIPVFGGDYLSESNSSCEDESILKTALSPEKYVEVKADTPGAIEAVVVGGTQEGKKIFIKKPESEPKQEKTIEDKKAILYKKRNLVFLEYLKNKLSDIDTVSPQKAMQLICIFGAKEFIACDPSDLNEVPDYSDDMIFQCILFKMIEWLDKCKKTPEKAERVGLLLDTILEFNCLEIMNRVISEIPEPKAWSKKEAE